LNLFESFFEIQFNLNRKNPPS